MVFFCTLQLLNPFTLEQFFIGRKAWIAQARNNAFSLIPLAVNKSCRRIPALNIGAFRNSPLLLATYVAFYDDSTQSRYIL